MNSTTNTPITTLRQHLVQLSAGLRLPPVAAALQEAGLASIPVGVAVAVEEAAARLEEARGAVAGLAAALQGVAGNAASAVLRCSRLELLDDGGRVRAVLGMRPAPTHRGIPTSDLAFYDANGSPVLSVGTWADDENNVERPALNLNGERGSDGFGVHGYEDGSLSLTVGGLHHYAIMPTGEVRDERQSRGSQA